MTRATVFLIFLFSTPFLSFGENGFLKVSYSYVYRSRPGAMPIGGGFNIGISYNKHASLYTGIEVNERVETFNGYIDSTFKGSPISQKYVGYTGKTKSTYKALQYVFPLHFGYQVVVKPKFSFGFDLAFLGIIERESTVESPNEAGRYESTSNSSFNYSYSFGVEGRYIINEKFSLYVINDYREMEAFNLRVGIIYSFY